MEPFVLILREVRDPRAENARHDCAAMLFTALIATLCGCKTCVEIADFVAVNEEELSEWVDLPHGAPSHDSYSRLFRLLDPDELATAFKAFAKAFREALGLGPVKGVVAVDGKSIRRGYERGKAHMPPLMVSVWDAQTHLSIAAHVAPGGSEVKATLAALRGLDLKGCMVTADALHCHPQMAETARRAGAHYALKLKGNNGPLHDCAIQAFEQADTSGKLAFHETSTAKPEHDRFERRRASVVAVPKHSPAFPGLVMFGRIQTERRAVTGKTSSGVHYVALSRKISPAKMLETVRAEWSVENNLHWPLDVVFHEDDARTRKDHAPANLSYIRRMALDILKAHPDPRSPARKMNLARWKQGFLIELFTHMR
jgi:predicted transposase YbfD/YdcC